MAASRPCFRDVEAYETVRVYSGREKTPLAGHNPWFRYVCPLRDRGLKETFSHQTVLQKRAVVSRNRRRTA